MNNLIRKFHRFWSFKELLKQLVIRDIKLKYRRSYLGYIWSILNPLMLMLVLVIVFSNLFKFDIPNFPVYLLSGQILFNFMVEATSVSVTSITGNAALLKKTYVPKYIFTVSKVISSLVNLLFSLVALLVVIIYTNTAISLHIFWLPIIVIQIFLFSLGIGMLLASLTVFFRDIQYLWGVLLTMWTYFTPIFYPVTIIPDEYLGIYKNINPMYWYIEQFRTVILQASSPDINSVLLGFLTAICFLLLGTYVFNKKQNEFILYI